jgi:hypothetical protein
MRKILSFIIAIILIAALPVTTIAAAGKPELDAAIDDAAKYILNTVKSPQIASVGGEWAIIGLARSGYNVPDSFYTNYYRAAMEYLKGCEDVLCDRKYTEYSRMILGLTAAGYDPRDVSGYDLITALENFDIIVRQGISGAIFALISLDSMNFTNSQRDNYIEEILRRQLTDGGWSLAGGTTEDSKKQTSDPNITGMVLQARSNYQQKPRVKAATDKALDHMSKIQNAKGGFISWDSENVESTVQVLVALCELGIPIDDMRFVKNGNTLVDNILSFRNLDGSFIHMADGSGNNLMSSEQALYGLVAAQRVMEGKNSLYRMNDTVKREEFTLYDTIGLPDKHADVMQVPVISPGKMFLDIVNHTSQIAIETLAERGIIKGKSEYIFDPDATMTRAEFAAIVTRGLGLAEKTEAPFIDVTVPAWYVKPVATAYYYNIITGVSSEVFNPNGIITRQESAVMLARAAKLCGMDTNMSDEAIRDILSQFSDYRIVAPWAQGAMAFIYGTGIHDDTALDIDPKGAVRRCEIAEMLYRMLDMANLL